MIETQRKKAPSTYQITNQRTPQPIWKRVNDRTRDTTSLQKNKKNIQLQTPDHDKNINQFLLKIQKKISQSNLSSSSEIMQKISIDWPQEISSGSRISRYLSFDTPNRQQKDFCQRCQSMVMLKDINNIQKLVQITKQINPTLHQQLQDIISKNQTLQKQNSILKQNEIKTKQKISNLCMHILALQTKNTSLINQLNQLRSQVNAQIKLQYERIKYQYEEMIQEIKKKIDKEQSDKTSSTRYSLGVDELNKSLDCFKQAEKQRNIDRKENISKKDNKNRISLLGNDKEQNFERVVFDIIKPHRREDRSLKLSQISKTD